MWRRSGISGRSNGTSLATGLPSFVMTISWRVSRTSLRTAKHLALNSLDEMLRGSLAMLRSYSSGGSPRQPFVLAGLPDSLYKPGRCDALVGGDKMEPVANCGRHDDPVGRILVDALPKGGTRSCHLR